MGNSESIRNLNHPKSMVNHHSPIFSLYDLQAIGLNAPDGEREKLVTPVKLEGPVEALPIQDFGGTSHWVPPKKLVNYNDFRGQPHHR